MTLRFRGFFHSLKVQTFARIWRGGRFPVTSPSPGRRLRLSCLIRLILTKTWLMPVNPGRAKVSLHATFFGFWDNVRACRHSHVLVFPTPKYISLSAVVGEIFVSDLRNMLLFCRHDTKLHCNLGIVGFSDRVIALLDLLIAGLPKHAGMDTR